MAEKEHVNFIEVAPLYIDGSLTQTLDNAMRLNTFTYRSEAVRNNIFPEITLTDELRDSLNYILHPEDVQQFTKTKNTPMSLMKATVAAFRNQRLDYYTPEDTLGKLTLLKRFQDNDMVNALVTVTDIETVTSRDAFGAEKTWIYNAAFNHVHKGSTIGAFQKDQFQNFFIGIYDKAEADYLSNVADIVQKQGVKGLDKDQKIAFEYLSRLGASIDGAEDLVRKSANDIALTNAAFSEFGTLHNFNKAFSGLQKLNTHQMQLAADIAKKEGIQTFGLNSGVMAVMDNLAEIIVNKNSLVTGYNVNFDVSHLLSMAEHTPGAEQYLRQRIGKLTGVDPGHISADMDISALRQKMLDPYQDMIRVAPYSSRKNLIDSVFNKNARVASAGLGQFQFEAIAKGMAMNEDLSQNVRDIYAMVHHLAGTDVAQESHFILDPSSPFRTMINEFLAGAGESYSDFENFSFKQLLFQAQDAGSLQQIQKYNKNVFATVKSSNGNVYMSNGMKWDAGLKKLYQGDQFTPGAWSQDVTYEITSANLIGRDTKLAKWVTNGNPNLAGEDLIQVNYKIASSLLLPDQRQSEAAQELRTIYMPQSMAERMFSKHIRITGFIDEKGNTVFNQFAKDKAGRMYHQTASGIKPYTNTYVAYMDANQRRMLDRAERSFTKHSMATNENAFALKEILEKGNFIPGQDKGDTLQKAIQEASNNKPEALKNILKGTNIKESAEEITNRFRIVKDGSREFSNAWLTNTLTISESFERGSLFEQLHNSAIEILNSKQYQSLLETNDGRYLRNSVYNRVMDEGLNRAVAFAPKTLKDESMHSFVDDIGKFYLNAADFVRGYRSENYVYGTGEDAAHYWMRIDMTNPYSMISEVKKATGLMGRRAENERNIRRGLISFTDYMSHNKELTKEERDLFKELLGDGLGQKTNYQLANDLTGVFEQLKNRTGLGWAPSPAFVESQSFLVHAGKQTQQFTKDQIDSIIQSMWTAADEQRSMFVDNGTRKSKIADKIRHIMSGSLAKTEDYTAKLAGYDAKLQEAMRTAYDTHIKALSNYTDRLVDSLEKTGIAISVGDTSVRASYGKKTIDITGLIPKLRSNETGVLSWLVGNRDTAYVASTVFGLTDDFHLTMESMLDYASRKSFAGMQKRLQRSIDLGEDPLSLLEWYIKNPDEILRQAPPTTGSPAGDIRNMLSGSTEGIFGNKSTLEKLVAHGKTIDLNEDQKKALENIEGYLSRWKRAEHPSAGLAEDSALTTLIYGENAVIGPKITGTNLFVNAGAKQTGSDDMRLMFADMPGLWELQNDPGKMVQNQLDNALYFKTNLGKQEQRILDAGGIKIGYGPQLATAGERKLSEITSGGVSLTNRLRLGVVEANDRIKEEIVRVLRQNYKDGETLAKVFGSQFMPYEGGGWISSRVWDTLQNPVASQMRKLNKRQQLELPEAFAKQFSSLVDLQFDQNTGEFIGYGRGAYVPQDHALWGFYSRFMQKTDEEIAKRDSILSVAYVTKDGKQVVDAETLKQNVAAYLKKQNIENASPAQWAEAADALYDRSLVARRVYDEGFLKLGVDSEKHISVSGARSIADYTLDEEKVLHDIFYSEEFDPVVKRIGDFREGRTLSADLYYDIARLDLKSPIFHKGEGDKIRTMIRNKMRASMQNASEQELDEAFYKAMDIARHKISDLVENITHGGTVLSASAESIAKHGNVSETVKATVAWLARQMAIHQGTIDEAGAMATENLQKAYQMLENNQVLRDESGRALKIIDEKTGQVRIETNHVKINEEGLRDLYRFNGEGFDLSLTEDELKGRLNKALSFTRDVEQINGKVNIFAHLEDVSVIRDTEGSDKLYKITDREINSYTNTLWDQDLVNRLRKNMDAGEFEETIGRYVENGKLKQEYLGKSVYDRTLDRFFRDDAFTRYHPHSLMLKHEDRLVTTGLTELTTDEEKHKALVKNIQDGGITGYRAEKTAKLVEGLGVNRNVSASYADDLYEVASLQRATQFNLGGRNAISAEELLTDKGKATGGDYFRRAHIEDILTSHDAAKDIALSGDPNIFHDNLLIDLESESLGLDRTTLKGRTQIAVAGVALSKNEDNLAAAGFQKKLAALQRNYIELGAIDRTAEPEEYNTYVRRINELIDDITAEQKDYALGRVKSSKTVQLAGSRIPASATNKVQVMGFIGEEVGERTFNGQKLVDLYKAGKSPNVAFVGLADLEKMGFTEDYFKTNKIDRAAWLKKIETEGMAGSVHRWPSDYWGSTMQVQVYLDRNIKQDIVKYDDITAAFLKADSDGDYASLMLHTVVDKDGTRYDLATAAELVKKGKSGLNGSDIAEAIAEHRTYIDVQRYDLNQMIQSASSIRKQTDDAYKAYLSGSIAKGGKTTDVIEEIMKKNARMDLAGNISFVNMQAVSDLQRTQYLDEFSKVRGRIASALDSIASTEDQKKWIRQFKDAESHADAAAILRTHIGQDHALRESLYQGLGDNAEAINKAFVNAASVDEARTIALQRIARKGVGLADTPYTAIDFLRMSAIGSGQSVLNNTENTALFMVKELSKEQLLTPKKMTSETVANISASLDELSDIINSTLSANRNDAQLKQRFIRFMAGNKTEEIEGILRDPNSRYEARSLLANFATSEGKIDMEKMAGTAYDAMTKSVDNLRANRPDIFRKYSSDFQSMSRFFKGRVYDTYHNKGNMTYSALLNRTILNSNGFEDIGDAVVQHNQRMEYLAKTGEEAKRQLADRAPKIAEKVVKDFRPGKGLALSALGLAAAAVFGGYAGGNPATPAQQQAQGYAEQEPPPRNINLADPSLTTSNRKQPGYVININAQTERDKEYASRLITQAVTKNFQDTNINVSMNVNQQRGNISGNDLMDYLTQALN